MRIPAAILSAAVLLSAPLANAKPVPINGFVAKVNGTVITNNELEEAMKFRRMMITRIPDPGERAKQMKLLKSETLESLIERELILSEFETRGGQIKPEMIDDDIKKIIREDFDNKRNDFLAALKKEGTTLEKFRELQKKRIAVSYMRSAEMKDIPVASPKAIKKFYDSNNTLYRAEGFIRLRTLTMTKAGDGDVDAQKKLVDEIHKKLLGGADFGTLAKNHSIDSAAANGGDRGVIGRGTEELRKDLVELAFRQPTGKVSPIYPDQAFYYILKVESRKLGKRAPLSDPKVRDDIEKRLLGEQRKAAQDRWLTRLKKTAIIKRYM